MILSLGPTQMMRKGCNFEDLHEAWVVIWSIEASPKVRHFLWRLCTEKLPTRGLLHARHLIEDDSCPWCDGERETASHAIFGCPRTRDLWVESGCARLIHEADTTPIKTLFAGWKNVDAKLKKRVAWMSWCIWTDRNLKVFEGKTTPNPILLSRVHRMVEEHAKYATRIYGAKVVPRCTSSNKWMAPLEGVVNINVDASLATEGWVGMGVVGRNHEGRVVFVASRRVRA